MQFNNNGFQTAFQPGKAVDQSANPFISAQEEEKVSHQDFDTSQTNYFLLLNYKNQEVVQRRQEVKM